VPASLEGQPSLSADVKVVDAKIIERRATGMIN
jgi:hypothetical protein